MQVSPDQLRGVDACQDRSLAGRALGQAFHTEPRIGLSHQPVERQPRFLTLKDGEEFRLETIERIMVSARTYSNAIDENQKNRHKLS